VQLGLQADAAPLVPAQVDHRAQPLAADLPHRRVELLAAIAAPGPESVAGEALGVNPNQWNMAVASGVVKITQHQRDMLSARLYLVPVKLEGAMYGR
jgi:hypothetical protein